MKWLWLFTIIIIIKIDIVINYPDNYTKKSLSKMYDIYTTSLPSMKNINYCFYGEQNSTIFSPQRRMKRVHHSANCKKQKSDEASVIVKKKVHKLGKKLALSQPLRKIKHHRSYNSQRKSRNITSRNRCSQKKEYSNLTWAKRYEAETNTTIDGKRPKRNYKVDITYNINNNPLCKLRPQLNHQQEFSIENRKRPHKISVNEECCPYGSRVWSVKANNFGKMNVKSTSNDILQVDTSYSNLKTLKKSKSNHHIDTIPQYCLGFSYNTDKNQTLIQIQTFEKEKEKMKCMNNKKNIQNDESALRANNTSTTETSQSTEKQPACENTTMKESVTSNIMKQTKKLSTKTEPNNLINAIKAKCPTNYDKKYGSPTLLSCLGFYGEFENHFVQLNEIAL